MTNNNNIGQNEKVESMTMATGRMDSTGVRNPSAQPIGQESGVSHPALGQNLGPMQQLLVRFVQLNVISLSRQAYLNCRLLASIYIL